MGARDADPAARAAGLHHPARAGRRVRLRRLPDRGAGRRDLGAGVVVPGRRGGDLDAAHAAAAGRRRPLVDPAPRRQASGARRRGAQGAAERAGDHRRLRPLRADRRPACCSPTASRPTVLDHDAEQIEALRSFGWRVYYGDATRLDLMRTAGADKARVIVVAIDDIEQSVDCARWSASNFPDADDRRARAQRPALLRAATSSA